MKRIVDSSPIVAGFVGDGSVKAAGGVYDIATGKVALI